MDEQEINYHLWRPSVISVRNPGDGSIYIGNTIVGVNVTRSEVIQRINNHAANEKERINEVSDAWLSIFDSSMSSLREMAVTLQETLTDIRLQLNENYGPPEIDNTQFILDFSELDIAMLS